MLQDALDCCCICVIVVAPAALGLDWKLFCVCAVDYDVDDLLVGVSTD